MTQTGMFLKQGISVPKEHIDTFAGQLISCYLLPLKTRVVKQ